MSAKLMKAMNMTSSFSNREKMRQALESPEQPFDLIAPLVHGAVIFPRCHSILLGRHDWDKAQLKCQLPGLIAFVCAVHEQIQWPWRLAQLAQQLAPLRRIVVLTGR